MSEKNLKDFMNKFIANVGDLYDPGHFYLVRLHRGALQMST